MREKITKWYTRRAKSGRNKGTEVTLGVHSGGADKDGTPIWRVVISFTPDAVHKITATEYMGAEIDRDLGRLYFVSEDKADGFKITNNANRKRIAFRTDVPQMWEMYKGSYYLLKDAAERLYYIDFK